MSFGWGFDPFDPVGAGFSLILFSGAPLVAGSSSSLSSRIGSTKLLWFVWPAFLIDVKVPLATDSVSYCDDPPDRWLGAPGLLFVGDDGSSALTEARPFAPGLAAGPLPAAPGFYNSLRISLKLLSISSFLLSTIFIISFLVFSIESFNSWEDSCLATSELIILS